MKNESSERCRPGLRARRPIRMGALARVSRYSKAFRLLAGLVLAVAFGAGFASAGVPTVDGRLYGSGDIDRYQVFSTASSGSKLLYAFADNTLYVALLVDRSVNDNVFGNRAYTRNAGWGPPHTARRLIDSEFAEFTLVIGNDPNNPTDSWTWKQGYAGQQGGGETNTDATWISDETVAGGGGTPPPGYTSASSFMWNLNNYANNLEPAWDMDVNGASSDNWKSPFDPAAPDTVIGLEGYPATGPITWSDTYQWEWPMIYEWSVDMSAYGQQPVYIITGSSHHSPAKTGPEDDDFPAEDPQPLMDFGDLPAPYPTLLVDDGARHILVPNGAFLGASVDAEPDGQPHPLALGDDLAGVDDEDGVVLLTPLIPGQTAEIEVTAGTAGYISVFIDWNGDGTLQALNLDSATVPSGAGTITAGALSDTHLSEPGVYVLTVEVPSDAAGIMPSRWRITNESGQGGASPTGEATTGEVEDHIFLGSIGDRVWIDQNQNGSQDEGEPGLAGVVVNLLDGNGAPYLDPVSGDPVTTVTDANGAYLFENLPGGDYQVEFIALSGYTFTVQDADGQGFDSGTNSMANATSGITPTVTLAPGEDNLNVDAGLYAQGTIGDTVFYDWNGNGVQDPGEAGIPGVTVTLTPPADVDLGSGDGVAVTTVTDANGEYLFTGLLPGEYTVTVPNPGADGVPSGYTLTASPDAPVSATHTYDLAENEIYLDADFGYQPGGDASLAGNVFEDENQDGVFDTGETGIVNVTVWLYHDVNGDGILDASDLLIATTTTDADGAYDFSGLDPTLSYLALADDGDSSGVDDYFLLPHTLTTTANPLSVTPADFTAQSNAVTDVDFGYYAPPPGSISGYVFEDLDNDGILDPGDVRLENVEVLLFSINAFGDRVPLAATTTDSDGYYEFTDLPAGNYVVVVNQADPDIPTGLVTAVPEIFVALAAGEDREDVNFPFVPLLEKNVDKAEAEPGDILTYTIVATPPAAGPLANATVSDPIPADTTFHSVGQGGTNDAVRNRVQWNLGSTVPGTQGTLTDRPRLFAFRGGDTATFWKYDVNAAAWTEVETFGSGVGAGGALISTVPDGGAEIGDVYGMRGNDTKVFRRYNIFSTLEDEWADQAPLDSVADVGAGGALAVFDGSVFALVGNNSTEFLRFDTNANSWAAMAPTPQTVGKGSALFTDRQSGFFALRGNNSPTLWRYNVADDAWETRAPAPASVGTGLGGASMASWDGNLYVLRGEGTTDFWRYDMNADIWTTTTVNGDPLPQAPTPIGVGASMAFRSIRLFVLAGGGRGFYRYNINENTWTTLPDAPADVMEGASLTSAGGVPARETEMLATPFAVRDGAIVTVQVTLSACQNCPNDTNIQPPAPDVSATGGASATYVSGPEPAPQDIPSGISRVYIYTYSITAGSAATPQSITFSIDSFTSGVGNSEFPNASANSVIVVPDLTFQVKVDETYEGGTITNTAQFFGESVTGLGVCYLLSESTVCEDGIARLIRVDIAGSTDLGAVAVPATATLAWAPDAQFLYAISSNQFGYLDLGTAAFEAIGEILDEDGLDGSAGTVTSNDLRVVAMAFAANGDLYAVHRREGSPDLLFRIDPFTGQRVADAFGSGQDYRVINATNDREDIHAISFAPDGTLYAVAANTGTAGDAELLVTIPDPATQSDTVQPQIVSNGLSPEGLIWVDEDLNGVYNAGEALLDIQGLSITENGIARIVTGDDSTVVNRNGIFQLDLNSAQAFSLAFPSDGCNYLAIACRDNQPFTAFDDAQTTVEIEPTLAVITGVRSRIEDGVAVISWDVSLELDTAGYYLERWVDGAWVRINTSLIGADPFAPPPLTYEQADPEAPLGTTQRYQIVELDGRGRLLFYGPYDLELDGGEISYATWAAGIDWGDADSSRDADPDGDGLTNWQEYLAGTDPLNANSLLRITHIEPLADGVRLTWDSEAGRVYAIEITLRLTDPFIAIQSGIEATPPTNSHVLPVDFDAVRGAFFRVILE